MLYTLITLVRQIKKIAIHPAEDTAAISCYLLAVILIHLCHLTKGQKEAQCQCHGYFRVILSATSETAVHNNDCHKGDVESEPDQKPDMLLKTRGYGEAIEKLPCYVATAARGY